MKNKKRLIGILAFVMAAVLVLGLVAGVLPQLVNGASLSELEKQLKTDAALDSEIADIRREIKK